MLRTAWIRDRRDALRLSQTEAAKRASVTQAQWAKWEAQSDLKRESVRKIAMALEMDVHEAMQNAGYLSCLPDSIAPDEELTLIVRKIPCEKQTAFVDAIRQLASIY